MDGPCSSWHATPHQSAASIGCSGRVHRRPRGGVVAINPSGNLLFERFSEAPWVPIDVRFDGTTCIVWEQRGHEQPPAAVWDFQIGGTGPIVALANAPTEGRGRAAGRGTPGNVCMLHESDGLTLVNTATGGLSDLCPCWGRAPWAWRRMARWESTAAKRCSRGEFRCRQSMAPVASGSQWPVEGQLHSIRASPRVGLSSAVAFSTASSCGAGCRRNRT